MALKDAMTQMFIERGKVIQAEETAAEDARGFGSLQYNLSDAKTEKIFDTKKKECLKELSRAEKSSKELNSSIDAWEKQIGACSNEVKEEEDKVEQKRKELQAVCDKVDEINASITSYNKTTIGKINPRPLILRPGMTVLLGMTAVLQTPKQEIDKERELVKRHRDWQKLSSGQLRSGKDTVERMKFNAKKK
jgi:hypothetical protein